LGMEENDEVVLATASAAEERVHEVAVNRLRLQACKERKAVLEAQLEQRRLTAELAQQKLKELKRRQELVDELGGGPKGAIDRATLRDEEAPVPQYQPAHGDYRLIDERLGALAKDREKQSLERKERLRNLNGQRHTLLQEQHRLETERLRLAADLENEKRRMVEETARVLEGVQDVPLDDKIPPAIVTKTQPVGIVVEGMHSTVRKIGLGLPAHTERVTGLKEEWFDYLVMSKQDGEVPPEIHPDLDTKHLLSRKALSDDEAHTLALETTIKLRMFEESQRKAMMIIVREMTHEVIELMASDIASEAAFSRFWAERTASRIVLLSLNSPKLLQDEPEALVQIGREFSQKRFQKAFIHVHTLTSQNAAIARVEESSAEVKKQKKKVKREDLDNEVQEEVEVLTLYSDLRQVSVNPDALERETAFWETAQPIPIYIKCSRSVALAEPAPNANMLAICPVGKGIQIYDIRHLPPSVVREEPTKSQVIALAWSDDSTQVATLEENGTASYYSLRIDRFEDKGVVDKYGVFKPQKLHLISTFDPVIDKKGKVNAGELEALLDVSDPPAWQPTAVCFTPSLTVTGTQPTVLLGLKGGTVIKHNAPHVKMSCFAKMAAPPPPFVRYAVRRDLPNFPAREYFVNHKARVLFLGAAGDGTTIVTMDADSVICTWEYRPESFSSLGWYMPIKVRRLNVSDFVLEEDPAFAAAVLFPPPGKKMKGPALDQAREKHLEEMLEMGIKGGPPKAAGAWKDDNGEIGRFEVRVSEDSTEEKMVQHMCRFNGKEELVYHRVARVGMIALQGAALKVKVDYSKKYLVILGLIPSGVNRQGLLTIFRLDLASFHLVGPRINIPLPKEIEKRYQKLGLSGDFAVDYDDIDFDVVPPLVQTGTQTLCLLLTNLVRFYSLETGQEVREPFDPLAIQQKKVLLDAVRVVGSFRRDETGGNSRLADDHVIIVTSAQSSTVYMYTIQEAMEGDNPADPKKPTNNPAVLKARNQITYTPDPSIGGSEDSRDSSRGV